MLGLFWIKCCFVFFICNKTFTALLAIDEPAFVVTLEKMETQLLVCYADLSKTNAVLQ